MQSRNSRREISGVEKLIERREKRGRWVRL